MKAAIKKVFSVILDSIVKYVSIHGLKIIRKKIVASILGLSGPVGFITGLALDFVIKKGWIIVETNHEVAKKKEAYDKIRNDPNSTIEERSKSFHDLLNN